MPTWLIEAIIVFMFGPPLMFGLVLLFLAGTYMQVQDEQEAQDGKA
jgi:hypothetical protein